MVVEPAALIQHLLSAIDSVDHVLCSVVVHALENAPFHPICSSARGGDGQPAPDYGRRVRRLVERFDIEPFSDFPAK